MAEVNIDPRTIPEEEQPGLAGQLQLINTDRLNSDFANLLLSVCHILSNSADQHNNLETCKDYCSLLRISDSSTELLFNAEKIAEIDKCTNFKQLFEIISLHMNWDEHSILTQIVNECKSVEGYQKIKEFEKKLECFQGLQIIFGTSSTKSFSKDFAKFCVIINKPYKNITIKDYKAIKASIFNNLNTHGYVTVSFIRILYHSLHIEWLVTIQAVPHMIKRAHQNKEFFIKDNFVFIQIGVEIVIDDKDTMAKLFKQMFNLRELPVKQKTKLPRRNEKVFGEKVSMLECGRSFEENTVESYAAQLKIRHNSKHVSESHWPSLTPAKFIELGYIIHQPKHTAQEAIMSAILARSGTFSLGNSIHKCDNFDSKNYDNNFDTTVIINKEVSNIFLPINNNKRPQIILIEGAPGIGKTMLMKEIRYLWATGKVLKDKKVLIFLSLCDLKINGINSIKDIFFYSCMNKEDAKILTKYFVLNSGQGLVILMDGLDENPRIMQSESFFYNILIKQKMFMEACIVITSRPHATFELQKHVSYRIEIIGFTDEKRREFVQNNLKENAEDLNSYLRQHEMIDTLCYIPLNMSIVLSLFNNKNQMKELPNSQTELTKKAVQITVLHNLQKLGIAKSKIDLENLPKPYDEIFYYLSALAYNALVENKLIFTSDEIRKACPISANGDETIERAIINGLGLMQTAQYFTDVVGDTESVSNFVHYSVQELLAAWHIAFSHRSYFCQFPLMCNIRTGMQSYLQFLFQLKVLNDNFWKKEFINVWSFYIGLTRGKDFAFKHFLSKNMNYSYMKCKTFGEPKGFLNSIKWLRLYLLLQETTANDIVESMDVMESNISVVKNKIKMLLLYFLLQEAPRNEMIKFLDEVVTEDKLDISEQSLVLKQDLNLLGHILSRPYLTKQWKSVNLSYCKINDEMLEVLHSVLTKNDGRPKPEIKELSLSNNKLKSCSNAIANLVCCQKVLHLNLSNNFLEDLTPFRRCGDFLETLFVSNNKLNNKKISESLAALKFLKKLRVLKLNHNDIQDDQDVNDAIGVTLCCCDSLEELELGGNAPEFENKALLLLRVINEVKCSNSGVLYYRLSFNKTSAFLKVLEYYNQLDNSCLLKKKIVRFVVVDISYNSLETDAGCFLGEHLHLLINLKVLNISNNNVSDEAIRSLTIGLLFTPNLEKFKYDENKFSEDSTMIFEMIHQLRSTCINIFTCPPSRIKALVFILQCIAKTTKNLKLSDIVSTISLITELIVSDNKPTIPDYKLTSEALQQLCAVLPWFKQLKVLDVRNNNITREATESLAKAMLEIPTLSRLKLIGNPIFDNTFSMAVFDTIGKLNKKQLQSITYNQRSPSHVEYHSVIYIMECLNKLDNPNCFKLFDNIVTLDIEYYANDFFEYLNNLSFLKILKINNVTCITDYGIKQLGKYLSQNRTLTTLDLSFCNLQNLDIEDGPGNSIPLKVLKFNHSSITNNVLFKLSLHMLMFANLDELDLGGNFFGDKGISNLHDVLLDCESGQLTMTITTLNLANNQLTSSSAIKIVEIVQICKVKYLNISDNYFENLLRCFEKFTITTLEELNISANNHQTYNAVQFAESISYLKSCSSLKKLNISNNSIDETAIDEIYYSFMECVHVEKVICNENPAENEIEVAFYFVQSLHTGTSNKSIFKSPPLKIKALVYLLRCINNNEEKLQSSDIVSRLSFVTELNLSHNQPTTLDYKLTNEDLKELFGMLTWFKQLEVLDIRNNDITNEATESLTKAMLQIPTLNRLKLIGNPIFDHKFSMAIFDTIRNLREKQLQSIIYNQRSPSHVEYHSIIYIMECLNKLDNPKCFESFDNIVTLDIESESDYASKIFEHLNYLPFLKESKINNVTCITDYGMKQLSKYLVSHNTLTTLDLSFCNLQNLDIEDGLCNSIPLKVLKFNHSNITDKVLFKLSRNMLMFANLDELDLEENFFGDKGISNLHDVLLDCESGQLTMTITTLNLANNQLTSSSATKIIEIVQICKVKYLNISDNYLENLLRCFENFMITTLEELNISANNHQTYNAVQFAENISYLKSCSSLKKLNISNNSIDETAIDEVYYSFMECVHLEVVTCNGNPARKDIKEAFDFVQSLYQQKQSCVELINFKELPKATLTLISKISLATTSAEIQVSQVRSIDFSNNKMKTEENFICVLQDCSQLEFLNLENNCITNDNFKYLATGFLFTSKLKLSNLNLNGNPCIHNSKNESVLQMIETLRSDIKIFKCTPAKFEIFLTILELVDGVNSKPNDIAKTISLITTLNMSYSELTNRHTSQLQSCDIKNFCNYFKYFKSLQSINMIGNNIKEDVKDDLVIAVLRNYSITEIHLEENPIHKYCKLFMTIGKLRRCRYAHPFKDTPQTLEALVNILQYVNNFADKTCDITNNIEHLDVSSFYQPQHNTQYGIEKIDNPEKISKRLIHYLTLFCNLKALSLHNANLTQDSLKELSKFLCNNDTLLQLDISNNHIQAEGALIILKSLETNTTLKKLNLSNNNIIGEKCKEVNKIIDKLSSVEVDMSGNEPTKAN